MFFPLALLAMQAGPATATPPQSVPFAVGERIEFGGKFTFINAGSAVLEVAGIDTVRGSESWHFTFTTDVSVPLYKNHSLFSSWTGTNDWISRVFSKDVSENDDKRSEIFRIYPDSGFYRRNDNTETKETSKSPLDDVAFFYWIRTVPLEVGKTYHYNNYFRAEHNPVTVKVEKREEKEMPDGSKVQTLLLRPVVDESNGMFSKKSKAKLWLTADSRRIPVQIETNLYVGPLKLSLKSYTPGGM